MFGSFEQDFEEFTMKLGELQRAAPESSNRESLEEMICVFSRRLFTHVIQSLDDPGLLEKALRVEESLATAVKCDLQRPYRLAIQRRIELLAILISNGVVDSDVLAKFEEALLREGLKLHDLEIVT